MKSLIKNYIGLLTFDKVKEFSLNNNINLTNKEIEYLLNLIKYKYDDILKNDMKYLEDLKNNIRPTEYPKVKKLYLYYKNKYKGYLF